MKMKLLASAKTTTVLEAKVAPRPRIRVVRVLPQVVQLLLLRVREHLVSLGDVLEHLLRLLPVRRILVRVPLPRQLLVGLLDVSLLGLLGHLEDLVIVLPRRHLSHLLHLLDDGVSLLVVLLYVQDAPRLVLRFVELVQPQVTFSPRRQQGHVVLPNHAQSLRAPLHCARPLLHLVVRGAQNPDRGSLDLPVVQVLELGKLFVLCQRLSQLILLCQLVCLCLQFADLLHQLVQVSRFLVLRKGSENLSDGLLASVEHSLLVVSVRPHHQGLLVRSPVLEDLVRVPYHLRPVPLHLIHSGLHDLGLGAESRVPEDVVKVLLGHLHGVLVQLLPFDLKELVQSHQV
mmetsp:Transcript_9760/g.27810  ORF Transcript_9760/g.27810 Transcript_9760/m.27810 type:complete len:344 (+) Transcript_9760:155-1186(+)